MQLARRLAAYTITIGMIFTSVIVAETPDKVDQREALALISRVGAKKPFLKDSPDIYLESNSLNKFFTTPIYRKLEGNGYFGYRYDEGFSPEGNDVQIAVFKDITDGKRCSSAYRMALENALSAAGLTINPKASCEIGICIVGIEERETERTLPGIMIEAFLRNSILKKTFFIRYGAGSPRGLTPAIRLSAEMLIAELQGKRILQNKQTHAQYPLISPKRNNLNHK
ncbi:MAG: hypothetical protein JXA73_22895 [Acidobacteria bacterium]|nr:hypothetical protein [Acidobacteriota bacterium]